VYECWRVVGGLAGRVRLLSCRFFTEYSVLVSCYLMPITYLFGIFANSINVVVFSRKTIQRVSNSSAVKGVIVFAVLFAFFFNTSRWFELQAVPCYSKRHDRESLVVYPTDLMVNSVYTVVYRNAAYTMVMFFLPFAILTFVNLRIIGTLRSSNRLNASDDDNASAEMREGGAIAVDAVTVSNTASNAVTTAALPVSGSSQVPNDRKENGVTVMLVAITTEFLLFNLLAFANNVLELTGAYGHTQLETLLVEVSALLVNINGASTIVIYLIFGSKYRAIFIQLLQRVGIRVCKPRKKSMYVSQPHYETTQLLDSRYDDFSRTRWKGHRTNVSGEERPLKTKHSNVTCLRSHVNLSQS
ncbi:hypothetical protein OSTOST_05739, partial [Ostertagia ostertagi]